TARRSLTEAWKEAFGKEGVRAFRRSGVQDTFTPTLPHSHTEALSYRAAFLGLGAGFAGLVAFSVIGGMSPWLSAAFFLLFFAIVLVVCRIRAELGPPVHDF